MKLMVVSEECLFKGPRCWEEALGKEPRSENGDL